jgi:hypothetical protein
MPGWLSAWSESSEEPPKNYDMPGGLPRLGEAVQEYTVCFEGQEDYDDDGEDQTCAAYSRIHAVHCGTFFLWQLPNTPGERAKAYCTKQLESSVLKDYWIPD